MKKTIADLWNGRIHPYEKCGNGNGEIDDIVKLIERNRNKLSDELNESQKAVFECYADCVEMYLLLLAEQAFCDGFSLGGKLVAEVFTEG